MTFRNEQLGYSIWKYFGKIDSRIFCDLLLNFDSLVTIPCDVKIEHDKDKRMVVMIYTDGIDICRLSFPGTGVVFFTKEDSIALDNIIARYKSTLITKGIK